MPILGGFKKPTGKIRKRMKKIKSGKIEFFKDTGYVDTAGFGKKKPTKHFLKSEAVHKGEVEAWELAKKAHYRKVAKINKKRQLAVNERARKDKELSDWRKKKRG